VRHAALLLLLSLLLSFLLLQLLQLTLCIAVSTRCLSRHLLLSSRIHSGTFARRDASAAPFRRSSFTLSFWFFARSGTVSARRLFREVLSEARYRRRSSDHHARVV
jgi:hypothetical protein